MDEDCPGLVVRGPREVAMLFYLREMSKIGNGSSHMDLKADTFPILINKLHAERRKACTSRTTNPFMEINRGKHTTT